MERSRIAPAPGRRIDFAGLCLLPDQRLLLQGDTPVRIGTRALDILIALTTRPGELVTKDKLIAQVWPNIFVDPGNLRVNMTALRKALGDTDGRLISTDQGRGYRFTADLGQSAKVSSPPQVAGTTRRLPPAMTRLTGSYPDGVSFVDLTTATGPTSIAAALAASLGVATGSDDAMRDVLEFLPGREMLLVIDNCEHVVDAAASLVEAITLSASGVRILATSCESLRVAGEWVRVLPPLLCPPNVAKLSAAEALSYSAVELFVERVADVRGGFQLSDAEAPFAGEICLRLDGVALAIELAAAGADVVGLTWLAAHLDDRLRMLNRGRRTAVQRHQTLSALHDWSYRLLSEQEQATLRHVASFPGDFTLSEAIAAASGDGMDDIGVVDAVAGLVSKSLAMLDISGPVTRFRLPATTRAYASRKMRMPQPDVRHAAMPSMH